MADYGNLFSDYPSYKNKKIANTYKVSWTNTGQHTFFEESYRYNYSQIEFIHVNITMEQSHLKVLLAIFCSLIANNCAGALMIMTDARMTLIFRSTCTLKIHCKLQTFNFNPGGVH
jgi:hypothetical protein